MEQLFGLAAMLSSTGWGLVNFAFSPEFLRSLGKMEERVIKTKKRAGSDAGSLERTAVPQASCSPLSAFYLKVCVAQSIEALEHLNELNSAKKEEDGVSDAEQKVESPVCVLLSGFIDGFVKQTCSSAAGPPLSLVPDDLVTVEIACKSQGADCCEFVTAHNDRITDVVAKELEERVRLSTAVSAFRKADSCACTGNRQHP